MRIGDYVVATKYHDGDPQDPFCIGFYAGPYYDRFLVVDNKGTQFRANGFCRIKKISDERGRLLVACIPFMETGDASIWYWATRPLKRLRRIVETCI